MRLSEASSDHLLRKLLAGLRGPSNKVMAQGRRCDAGPVEPQNHLRWSSCAPSHAAFLRAPSSAGHLMSSVNAKQSVEAFGERDPIQKNGSDMEPADLNSEEAEEPKANMNYWPSFDPSLVLLIFIVVCTVYVLVKAH